MGGKAEGNVRSGRLQAYAFPELAVAGGGRRLSVASRMSRGSGRQEDAQDPPAATFYYIVDIFVLFLLQFATFYYFLPLCFCFLTFIQINVDVPFRIVSRGSPGPPGSVLRRFEKVRGSLRKLEEVGEGSMKLEKVRGSWRKLDNVREGSRRLENVSEGSRTLEKVRGSWMKLEKVREG